MDDIGSGKQAEKKNAPTAIQDVKRGPKRKSGSLPQIPIIGGDSPQDSVCASEKAKAAMELQREIDELQHVLQKKIRKRD